MLTPHFVLFNHAANYSFFKESEEITTYLHQLEENIGDMKKLSHVIENYFGWF